MGIQSENLHGNKNSKTPSILTPAVLTRKKGSRKLLGVGFVLAYFFCCVSFCCRSGRPSSWSVGVRCVGSFGWFRGGCGVGVRCAGLGVGEVIKAWDLALADMRKVSRPCSSWNRPILTEIFLCHVCSCQEILRVKTAGQGEKRALLVPPNLVRGDRAGAGGYGCGGEVMGWITLRTDWDSPACSYFPGPVISPRTRG